MTRDDPSDLVRQIQDLTARSMAEQARALQRYNDLIQRMLRGELNDQQVRDEYTRFAQEETARYTRAVAQLSLGYYSALLELGRSYNDRFFDLVLRGRPSETQPSEGSQTTGQPRQVLLDLHGVAGQEAAAAFVIENKRATQVEISFIASDFADLAGGAPFQAPLQLQPPRFTLGPNDEAAVQLRLPLLHERFVPGHKYRAKVAVHGYDDLELIVEVGVDPRAATAERVATVDAPETAAPEVGAPQPVKRRRARGAGQGGVQGRGSKPAGGPRTPRSRNGHTG